MAFANEAGFSSIRPPVPRISAARRAEAMRNLRRFARPVDGCRADVYICHDRPPSQRYLVSVFVDTVGDDREWAHPCGEYLPQYTIQAWAFMDDFGSLVYTTRFA